MPVNNKIFFILRIIYQRTYEMGGVFSMGCYPMARELVTPESCLRVTRLSSHEDTKTRKFAGSEESKSKNPRPGGMLLPTSFTGIFKPGSRCKLLIIQPLRFSFGPPFQGLGGRHHQDPGRWPGLELNRAVGAGAECLLAWTFRA